MKLSRQMLIPIIVVSFLTLSAFGIISYKNMEQQVIQIYRTEIFSSIQNLEDEVKLSGNLTAFVMARNGEKNLALARALAEMIRQDPSILSYEKMLVAAKILGVDEVHVVNGEGILITGNVPEYFNIDFNFSEQSRLFLRILEDPSFEYAQELRPNGMGRWTQYYGVARTDAPGFVQVGINYDVAAALRDVLAISNKIQITSVGQYGYGAIIENGIITAHPDLHRTGEDVTDKEWYKKIADQEEGFLWLNVNGEEYLTGFTNKDGLLIMAFIPTWEYYAPLNNIRNLSIALIIFSSIILVVVLIICIRRYVIHPINQVSEVMNKVSKGNLNVSIDDQFTGEFSDLKESINRTIAQLKIREDRVINNYPGIIWSCDRNYICQICSGNGLKSFKINPDKIIGQNLLEILRPRDKELIDMMMDTFRYGPQRLNIKKRSRYLAISTELLYDKEYNITGLVGVCLDITDVQQMQKKLEAAIEEAELANNAKSQFLSRMSHEIRTPMNAIIGMTTIAQKTEDPEKISYCLNKIQLASDQLLNLINDVLDIAKIEANKFELSENEFDFETMLQNICNVIDVKVNEKKQNFIVDFNDVFTRNVLADELRLSQILINLLTNAVKFTPEGGRIILKIRYEGIDPQWGTFHFDVIDNGIGISEDHQKKLFASFEQGDGSITRRYGGTGLGLAICKSIVELMGGEIKLESQVGEGSHFSFAVNVRWGNDKGSQNFVTKIPLRDTRMLVIDDSEDVREYFSNILQNYSFACDTAGSGIQGIKMVEAALAENKPYQLIFVDWMMPVLNGIETAREIKNLVGNDAIVIMISVADWSEIEKEATSIGIDKFISKPVLPSVLFNSIIEWMNVSATEIDTVKQIDVNWQGKIMLLAEDIDINREIIICMLQETGIEIETAETGKQAVEIYLKAPDKYDIILMDLQMPEMGGLEATREIRSSTLPGSEDIPIIAMTANAFKSDVDECLANGMNDHIPKPVSMEDLLSKVAKALEARQK